eukprot:s166_g15.t1
MQFQGRWTEFFNVILAAWGFHRRRPHEACPLLAFAADVVSTFLCLCFLTTSLAWCFLIYSFWFLFLLHVPLLMRHGDFNRDGIIDLEAVLRRADLAPIRLVGALVL